VTVFRRRPCILGVRWHTERLCLELARLLHRGARVDELGKLIEDVAVGAATVHVVEEQPNG
jgi:hypothetical protein